MPRDALGGPGGREEGSCVKRSNGAALTGAEGDDAAHRIVWRDTDGDSIPRHDFDSETAHPAAQLRQHFVAGIDLHSVQPAAVNGDHGALHVNKIVFAQTRPFNS